MKKAIVLLMCTIIVFSTCSCSAGSKQLPESFIKFEIEDYIALEDIENYYTYETKHSYDSDSNLDTVDITITVQHDYADEIITGNCVYYYDKASDIWERARTTKWNEPIINFVDNKLEKKYSGEFPYNSGTYEITIHDINFESSTVNCSYNAICSLSWGRSLVVEGKDTFELQKGNFFVIPGNNGCLEIILTKDGVWIIPAD